MPSLYVKYYPLSDHPPLSLLYTDAFTRQILYAARMFYPLIQCTGKVAILLLYQRVFDVGHSAQWFPITIKVCIGLLFVGELTFILLIGFQCLPVAAIWDKTITDAKCLNLDTAYLIGAILTIGADLVLIVLPIPALRKLQISPRKRAGLIIVFGIGSFGIVASLVRIKYLIVEGTNVLDLTCESFNIHTPPLLESYTTNFPLRVLRRRPQLDSHRPLGHRNMRLLAGFMAIHITCSAFHPVHSYWNEDGHQPIEFIRTLVVDGRCHLKVQHGGRWSQQEGERGVVFAIAALFEKFHRQVEGDAGDSNVASTATEGPDTRGGGAS
jgi:hypothetical protein